MSKRVVRNGVFETNSSSVHSLSINTDSYLKERLNNLEYYKHYYLFFKAKYYGREPATFAGATNLASYLYTMILELQDTTQEHLKRLKELLDNNGILYIIDDVNEDDDYGIDHESIDIDVITDALVDFNSLTNFLCNTKLDTDNNN